MNKLLIIPGFSLRNKDWANEVKNFFKYTYNVEIHEWLHWLSGNNEGFSFDKEKERIKAHINKETSLVIAKSIGSAALAYSLAEIEHALSKIILCGIPLNDLTEQERKYYQNLKNVDKDNLVVFQNLHDDHGRYEQIVNLFKELNINIKVIGKDRDDHSYPYFEDFQKFLLD